MAVQRNPLQTFSILRLTLKEHPDEASQMEKSYNQPADAIYPHNTQYPGLQYYLKTKNFSILEWKLLPARQIFIASAAGLTNQYYDCLFKSLSKVFAINAFLQYKV